MAIGSETSTADRLAPSPDRRSGDLPHPQPAVPVPPAQPSAEKCRRVLQSDVASALTQQITADSSARPLADGPSAVSERRRRRSRWARLTYRTADCAMLLAASVTAIVAAPAPASLSNFAWGGAYALLTLLILDARGFYGFRLQDTPVDTVARIFAATSIAAMTLTAVRAIASNDPTLTAQTVRLWAFALVFLGAGRVGITLDRRRALRRGETGFNTLIIGAGQRRAPDRPAPDRPARARACGRSASSTRSPLSRAGQRRRRAPVLGASWDLERSSPSTTSSR